MCLHNPCCFVKSSVSCDISLMPSNTAPRPPVCGGLSMVSGYFVPLPLQPRCATRRCHSSPPICTQPWWRSRVGSHCWKQCAIKCSNGRNSPPFVRKQLPDGDQGLVGAQLACIRRSAEIASASMLYTCACCTYRYVQYRGYPSSFMSRSTNFASAINGFPELLVPCRR